MCREKRRRVDPLSVSRDSIVPCTEISGVTLAVVSDQGDVGCLSDQGDIGCCVSPG